MNGRDTHLMMIHQDAIDFSGVQEVPSQRVGDGYRYSNHKRVRGDFNHHSPVDSGISETTENEHHLYGEVVVGAGIDENGNKYLLLEDFDV